jgi:hypothetical protein
MIYRFYQPSVLTHGDVVVYRDEAQNPSVRRVLDIVTAAERDDMLGMPFKAIFEKHGAQPVTSGAHRAQDQYVFERLNALHIYAQQVVMRIKDMEPEARLTTKQALIGHAVENLVRGREFFAAKPGIYGDAGVYNASVAPMRDQLVLPVLDVLNTANGFALRSYAAAMRRVVDGNYSRTAMPKQIPADARRAFQSGRGWGTYATCAR